MLIYVPHFIIISKLTVKGSGITGGHSLAVTCLTSNPGVVSTILRRTNLSDETLNRDPMYTSALYGHVKESEDSVAKSLGSYTRVPLYLLPSLWDV